MKHKIAIVLGPALAVAAFFTDSLAGLAALGLVAAAYLAFMIATDRAPKGGR